MNLPSWHDGHPALNAAGELNALFNKRVYTPTAKRRMLHLLKKFGLLATRSSNPFLEFRKIRGALFEHKRDQPARIVATGRESWAGWIDLKKEPLDHVTGHIAGRDHSAGNRGAIGFQIAVGRRHENVGEHCLVKRLWRDSTSTSSLPRRYIGALPKATADQGGVGRLLADSHDHTCGFP